MFLKFFRGTGPGVIFLIALALTGLWISAFIDPQLQEQAVYETSPMPLYGILKSMIGTHPLAGVIFSFVIMTAMLFLITWFNTSVFFINERTFLPALLYTLICGLFPGCRVLNPVLPAALLLMIAVMRIMETYRMSGTAFNFFDAGILISIGSMFYMNLIWFGLLLIIGIALLRTGSFKEPVIALLGLITPYILLLGIFYVLGKDISKYFSEIRYNLFGETGGYDFTRLTIITSVLLGLMSLISSVFLIMKMSTKKIKSRKTFFLMLWLLLIGMVIYFFLPSASTEMIYLAGIPVCYILAHYFVFEKKRLIPEIMFSGFFLLVIMIHVLLVL